MVQCWWNPDTLHLLQTVLFRNYQTKILVVKDWHFFPQILAIECIDKNGWHPFNLKTAAYSDLSSWEVNRCWWSKHSQYIHREISKVQYALWKEKWKYWLWSTKQIFRNILQCSSVRVCVLRNPVTQLKPATRHSYSYYGTQNLWLDFQQFMILPDDCSCAFKNT